MGQVLLIDATSIFAFQQHLKQQDYPVQGNINYGALLAALRVPVRGASSEDSVSFASDSASPKRGIRIGELAKELGTNYGEILTKLHAEGLGDKAPNHMSVLPMGLAQSIREWFSSERVPGAQFENMFAFVAINPEHEGQQKFCAYLRGQGFTVDETDFRDAFIIPGRENPYQRLSTRITYLAGMLAAPYDKAGNQRQLPNLLVVTDAFDVYYPLLDYVQNRKGKVSIAFFKRGMEDRWQRAGLFDGGSPIGFRDLSDNAKSIIGADLASSFGTKEGGKGLADFKL